MYVLKVGNLYGVCYEYFAEHFFHVYAGYVLNRSFWDLFLEKPMNSIWMNNEIIKLNWFP